MKYSEKLYHRYKEEIESWEWNKIKENAIGNCFYDSYDSCIVASEFLGTVFALTPSGKYYMPWTTNQTVKDVIKDQAFHNALNDVAEKNGMCITCGECDPCDIFAQFFIDFSEYRKLENNIQFVTSDDYHLFMDAYNEYLSE
jgi:hypothetical protein